MYSLVSLFFLVSIQYHSLLDYIRRKKYLLGKYFCRLANLAHHCHDFSAVFTDHYYIVRKIFFHFIQIPNRITIQSSMKF